MGKTNLFILVAEDDKAIATGLTINLELQGYRVEVAEDGMAASDILFGPEPPDLVLLDLGLPHRDGLEILSALAKQGVRIPVIVLSARLSESDKVAALRLGADDYVTKPFALAELMARLEAVLRRTQYLPIESDGDKGAGEEHPVSDATSHFGNIQVARDTRIVTKAGGVVSLTRLEFELLCFFLDHPNRVLSRSTLLKEVWGTSGARRTVDNFVGQLRTKLEEDLLDPKYFLTVRGAGYRFVATAESDSSDANSRE